MAVSFTEDRRISFVPDRTDFTPDHSEAEDEPIQSVAPLPPPHTETQEEYVAPPLKAPEGPGTSLYPVLEGQPIPGSEKTPKEAPAGIPEGTFTEPPKFDPAKEEYAGRQLAKLPAPFKPIPRLEGNNPNVQAFLAGAMGRPVSEKEATAITSLYNTGKGFAEFIESPLGIATAGVGGIGGPVLKRIISGLFALDIGSKTPEAARKAGEASVTGTPQEQLESGLGLATTVLLPAMLAKHSIGEPISEITGATPSVEGARVKVPVGADKGLAMMADRMSRVAPATAAATKSVAELPIPKQVEEFKKAASEELPKAPEIPSVTEATPKASEVTPKVEAIAPVAPTDLSETRTLKLARIKDIQKQVDVLAKKGGLTASEASEFRKLNAEANSLRYEIAKPLTLEQIQPSESRKSTLSANVVLTARNDLVRNKDIYDPIIDAAIGVSHNAPTAVDEIMQGNNPKVSAEQLYSTFEATREAMRKQYGNTITLFRSEGLQSPKPTQNWATTKEYAQQFGQNVISKRIPIDDVIAVNVGLRGKYHEVIVGKKPTDLPEAQQATEKGKVEQKVSEVPKQEPPAKQDALKDAWDKFDNTGEIQTARDLADVVEGLIVEGKAPESLQNDVDTYREAVEEDFKMAGRGDLETAEKAFTDTIKQASGKPKSEPKTAPAKVGPPPSEFNNALNDLKANPQSVEALGKAIRVAQTAKQMAEARRIFDEGKSVPVPLRTPDVGAKGAEETKTTLPVWKVSYTDLETRAAKRPFFKHTVYSEGRTKAEALERVQRYHGNSSRYGEWRASKATEGQRADSFFRAFEEENKSPVTSLPAAVEKVSQQVKEVARTEGQRPAKEVKAELVARIEQSIKDVESSDLKQVTIDIPGDGNFTVPNTKESLNALLARAKRIPVDSGKSKAVVPIAARGRETISPEHADKLIDAYGSAAEAAKRMRSQSEAQGEEYTPQQKSNAAQLADDLEQRAFLATKPENQKTTNFNRLQKLRKDLESAETDIEHFQSKIDAITPEELKEIQFARAEKKRYQEAIKQRTKVVESLRSSIADMGEPIESRSAPTPEPEKPILGMGGAVKSEFEQPDSVVSNMFAAIDRDRAAMGKSPMPDTKKRTWDEDNAKALARMNRDPDWISNLIDEVSKQPRPLRSDENAGLVWQRAAWKAELNNAYQRIAVAHEGGAAETLAEAKDDALRFEDKLEKLDAAVGRNGTGSEAGRTLQAQKMGAGEDFSLVEMKLEARARKGGGPLSEAETAEVEKAYARISELEKQHAADLETARQLQTEKAIAQAKADAIKVPAVEPHIKIIADQIKLYFDRRADAAQKRLSGKLFTLGPQVIADLTDLGVSKILSGAIELGEWSAKMIMATHASVEPHLKGIWDAAHAALKARAEKVAGGNAEKVVRAVKKTDVNERIADTTDKIEARIAKDEAGEIHPLVRKLVRDIVERTPDITRDALIDEVHSTLKEFLPEMTRLEAMDAISGRGKFWLPPQDAVSKTVRDLSTQIRLVGHQMDVLARKPLPRTGYQPEKMSDAARREEQRLNDLKRQYGVVVTDPASQLASTLSARKTYYTHRLSDLRAEIKSGERIVRSKSPSPTDPALETLKAEYQTVKAEHDSIFAKGISDEQRLKLATAAAERNEKQWNERLADAKKGIFDKKEPGRKVTGPELEAIRARTEAVKNEVQELKDSDIAFQESKQVKALTDSIAEYERKIAAKELETSKKPKEPISENVRKLTEARDTVRAKLAEMREASGMYDAKRIEAATKAVDTAIEESIRQINEGDLAVAKGVPRASTPELDAKRGELADLQKIKQKLRNAEKSKTPSEIEARKIADVQKQIDEVVRQINEGDLSAKAKAISTASSERTALQSELADLNKVKQQLRNAANPKKTPEEVALQSVKTRMATRLAELKEKNASGDYTVKARTPVELDAPGRATKIELEKEKLKWDEGRIKARLANRTPGEKKADAAVKWSRTAKLASWKVYPKLLEAALGRQIFEPIGRFAGLPLKAIAPSVFRKGQLETSINIRAEGQAWATAMSSWAKAWQKLRTGTTDIDVIGGKRVRDPEMLNMVGNSHGMFKEPTRQGHFQKAKILLHEEAIRDGLDPHDPVTETVNLSRAAEFADRSIFMRPNEFTKFLIKVPIGALKSGPFRGARSLARTLEFLMPIVNVPSNITVAALRLNPVVGLGEAFTRLAVAAKRGELSNHAEKLSKTEAETIARAFKLGMLGTVLAAYAWNNPEDFGGAWEEGRQKKDAKLKHGEIKIMGTTVPAWMNHVPELMLLNTVASARRVRDRYIAKNPGQTFNANSEAFFFALMSPVKNFPFIDTYVRLFSESKSFGRTAGAMTRDAIVPGAVTSGMDALDPTKRKPKNFMQELKMAAPPGLGVRETVPAKP